MSPRQFAWPTARLPLLGAAGWVAEQTDSRLLVTSVPDWDALLMWFREGSARPVLLDQDRAGLIAAERPAEVKALTAQADRCRMLRSCAATGSTAASAGSRMPPLFSFLTTAYRTERYVGETIDSVLAQTRTDWELIVVDNGNSDEMARVVEKYTGDSRIKLVRQENKGVRGGVTAAADVAVGRYLCPLNSDDLLQPDFCERVGTLIDADPGIDAVGCDAECFRDPYDGRPPVGILRVGSAVDRCPTHHGLSRWKRCSTRECRATSARSGATYGKPTAHSTRPPADVEPDVALWLSVAAAGRDIRVLPDRLARIRVRPDSLSHDPSGTEAFESRLQQTFLAVCEYAPVSEAAVSTSRMMRRMRYNQAMRRARWALFDGDVHGARASASDAYRHQRTLRAAAVIVALRISPRMLRSIHPAMNRAQNALRRARFRIARGRAR